MVKGKDLVGKKVIYELGRWSDAYFARRSSEITDFFCWKCKRDFHRVSMYEHFSKCSPAFFKRISKPKDEKLSQEYFERDLFGKVIKKTRKVEVSYVDQGRCSAVDADGIVPALPGGVLQAGAGEDRGPLFEASQSEDVKPEPEPVSEIPGRLEDDLEDQEDF